MTSIGYPPRRDLVSPRPSGVALASIALGQFVLELREVRRVAGDPSYAALVRRMNGQFSKATISRVLNGAEPSWLFTRSFLGACGISDAAVAAEWHPKWTSLRGLLHPLIAPDPAPAPATHGEECDICGGWATNPQRHADYHRRHDPRVASSTTAD